MFFVVFFLSFFIAILIMIVFFLVSKLEKWDFLLSSVFECGFSSYFYSRFSFSIHYFMVGLIFLFLDLELCILMPFMNLVSSSFFFSILFLFIIFVLLFGLLLEWKEKKLDWVN